MENKKTNIQDVPLAIQLRKRNYEDYMSIKGDNFTGSSGVDMVAARKDLAKYNKDSYNENLDTERTEEDTYKDMDTFDLVTNSVKQTLVSMNEAQIANTQGILRREVLPNIEKTNYNINAINSFNDLMSQRNELLNRSAEARDSQELGNIQNAIKDIEERIGQTKKYLNSIGISPDMSNTDEVRVQLEKDLEDYNKRAQELYDDIETDEADANRFTVDERFKKAAEQYSEFEFSNPSKWVYSVPSAVGSSSSAWLWQIAPYATTALKSVATKALLKVGASAAAGAAAGSVVPVAGTGIGAGVGAAAGAISTALDVGNAAMLIYSNYKQAVNEANANVSDDFRERVVHTLSENNVTISDIADQARAQGLPEKYQNLPDDKIFEKILDGQINVDNEALSQVISSSRLGMDRDFAQNMAITWASNVASDMLMLPYFGKVANNWVGKGIKGAAKVMDPVEAVGEFAADKAKKKLTKYVLGRNAIDKASKKWANRAAKAAYVGTDLAIRNATDMLIEGVEEGSQYTTGQAYKRGDFDDSELNLSGLASSLLGAYKEKARTVANILGSPFGYQNSLYENDTEYWNNVKLGAAASLLSPLSGISNVRGAYALTKETQGMNRVNELAAEEINTKENMTKAITYAGGRFKGHEAEVVNAWQTLAEGPTESLPEGFNREDALEEARYASRAFALAKSDKFKDIAAKLDIEPDTEEFGELAGIYLQTEKDLVSSIKEAKQKDTEYRNVLQLADSNEVLNTLLEEGINNAFGNINNSAENTDHTVSKEEIREIFNRTRQSRIIDSMVDEINKGIEILQGESNTTEFRGNQYSLATLEDMRFRLQARQKELQRTMPKWYKKNESHFESLTNSMSTLSSINELAELDNATEDQILANLKVERNREILNSFVGIGNGKMTGSEAREQQGIIALSKEGVKDRSSKKTKKKRANLKLKALRNIHNNQGEALITEMFDLYQQKKNESKQMVEGMSGVEERKREATPVVPSKPISVPSGKVVAQETPPVIEPISRPKPVKPKKNIAAAELSEADAALIAAAEGQDIGLKSSPNATKPEAKPAVVVATDTSEKERPAEVTSGEPVGPTDDPFAGGTGEPTVDDGFTETGNGAIEPRKNPSESRKEEIEIAKEVVKEAAKEFTDILRSRKNMRFAYDPEAEVEEQIVLAKAFLKLLNASFKLGVFKFKDVCLEIYEAFDRNREELAEHFDKIKGAYTFAYSMLPEEQQKQMTTPVEALSIIVDDLFETPVTDLTDEQVNNAAKEGVIPTPEPPGTIPPDAITDEDLSAFSEDSGIGILNTFHYRPNVTTGEAILINGKQVIFSPNSELPSLLNNHSDRLSYEFSVAPYFEHKSGKTVDWSNPNTYDYARVGMIITDSATNNKYWVAMRSPNNIKYLSPEERAQMIPMLRDRRYEIISRFVKKDSNDKFRNELDYNIKVTPTRLLLHNAVKGTHQGEKSLTDKDYNDVFYLSNDLDEEIPNFAYSTGVRSTSNIFTLDGQNAGFGVVKVDEQGNEYIERGSTTAGGIYYIINGKKRLSGRPLPVKLRMARLSKHPDVAKILTEVIFKSGFRSGDKIGNTDLIGADLISLFLHYGESTRVNPESEVDESVLTNLRNKQLYVDNTGAFGVLHYGNNQVQLAGLSAAVKEQEKKHFTDWLLSSASVPFKVEGRKNPDLYVNMPLNQAFQGRLSSSVEKAGGRLELFKGIVFTREDMNKSLLAWMIKSGLIQSNLDAAKYKVPYIIADGLSQSAPTSIPQSSATPTVAQPIQAPAIEPAPKASKTTENNEKVAERPKAKKRRSFSDLTTMGGSKNEVKINFTPNKKYTTNKKMNPIEAKRFLKEKLGMNDAEISIIETAISSDMPSTALSHMTRDAIILATSDPEGVAYHEGYHRVSLLLMSNEQRQKVYDDYRKTHKNLKNASDKVIEEYLAEDFRNFMLTRVPSKAYRITKWFDKLRDFVYALFGRVTTTSIFRGIYEGKYANVPVNPNSKARFEAAYGDRVNFVQHGHEFKNIRQLDNYNQAVEFFAISYINMSLNSQDVVNDLSKVNIDYDDMKDLLLDLSEDTNASPEQRAAVAELYDNFDIFKIDLESYLSSLSLKKAKEEQEYEDIEERDGGDIEKENFDNYEKASYEMPILHNIRPAVKLFLSSIEDRVYKNGAYVRDMNAETGLPRVTPFLTAWRRIVNELFDEDTYDGLIMKSATLAKTDPFFASVYDRLSSVENENLQTQIFQTITGYEHNFLTVGFQNVGEDTIQYIANLGGSVNLRNGKKIISDWNRNFFNSDLVYTDTSGNIKPDMAKLKAIKGNLSVTANQLAKLTDSSTNEEFNEVLYKFVGIYNSIGIAITYDTLFQAIVDKVASVNSVNKPTLLQAAKSMLASNIDGSLAKAVPEILNRPVKDKPSDRIKRSVDSIFTGENSILNLAIIHYQKNSNSLEEKILGPKNTTVYPLSKYNYLTLEVKKLNNDRSYVSNLLKCPINSSSLVYNSLKSNPNTRLTVGTLLNITEYNSGNTGTDYQSAPKIETFIAKFVCSENSILLLPTMSDKKTYMPIQGIKLFKNKTLNLTPVDDRIDIRFSNEVLEQFYKYYKSEYDAILQYRRMKLAEDKINDANRPIKYFGTKGKDDGKGGKFRIARGVHRITEEGKVEYLSFDSMDDKELMDYFNNVSQFKEDLNTTLQVMLGKQLDYVKKLGLIEKGTTGLYTNSYLPTSYINERTTKLAQEINGLTGEQNKKLRENIAILDAIATFTVNNFVSMFEAEKVFYKDVAFYKNYPDVSKRLAGTLSTGDRPRIDFKNPNNVMNSNQRFKQGRYNVVGLKDIQLRTNQPVELYKSIYNAYVREYMEASGQFTDVYINEAFESDDLYLSDAIPADIKSKAKQNTERDLALYGDIKRDDEGNIEVNEEETPINQADASVYVSPTMYKAILASHGQLTPEVEAAIDYVEEHADDLGDIRKYTNTLAAVLSPKKMVYFGNEILQPIQGEFINMPIFNKMAIFPLFKVLATGDLRALYDRMADEKNPIDMFTTNSAVKVGNIVEYDFYTDATQNELTDFFTKDEAGVYKQPMTYRQQNFGNLLNQMPIEAHDAEKRMLVTQAMKTVYSNIRLDGDYTLPGGKTVKGREMRDLAMRAIDNLSDRGLNRMLKELHVTKNEDGTYSFNDLKGLSDKLQRDLLASNADLDIIDQVTLNEKGEFKVPLSASPIAKQLVSKIISAVNKETVDINLPGGTFVQMSSFGLKSITKVKASESGQYSKYMINGGERLKLKNDNNSMDCVISINLLKHIIPGYNNMTFLEARQWLIDNNIIGKNASPSSMAYRVPTQGMSSIAALTIRDIVMSQAGDIIIMPDEFTARTGSDFDIDKLFLTRYNYTVKRLNIVDKIASKEQVEAALKGYDAWADEVLAMKDGEPVTRRNSMKASESINQYLSENNSNIKYDVLSGSYRQYKYTAQKTQYDFNKSVEENSQGAVENLLIDTFMASMLDPKNVHDTTRPLDVPVNIMKNGIVKTYFPDVANNTALFEYTEEYQDNLKQDFADSKSGIGPFALNNPHHVLGQLVELVMKSPEYMPNMGNLHKVTGVDDIHILDWLSALISAHVDVAKDNYIIKLNVNTFTYNITNLLLRNGVGKNTMYFVSQEIMKRMAQDYIQSKGVYAIDNTKSFNTRYQAKEKAIVDEFTEKAKSLANKDQREALKDLLKNEKLNDTVLFEIPEDGKLGYLENLLDKANKKDKDFDYYYGQIMVYKLYKQLDPMARALSDLVKASQVDTKKFGKNAIEMRQFLDKVADMYQSPYFTPEMIKKFYNDTFLQKKIDNSILFTLDLLSNVNLQSKKEYYSIFKSFVNASGLSSVNDKQTTTAITNAIDSHYRAVALYDDVSSPLIGSLKGLRDMFMGDNTIAKRLNKIKEDIIEDAANRGNKYPIISVTNGRINNLFLNSLTGITDTTGKAIDYIRFDYSDDISSNASRQIREYWQELLDSDNQELHDLAFDLIRYAVFNGHGSKHLNTLFDFIPTSKLEEFGYYDVIRNLEENNDAFSNIFTKEDVDEIYRNNWQNNTLVPIINTSAKGVYVLRQRVGNKMVPVAIKGSNRFSICKNLEETPLYHPYVKVRDNNATGGYNLYKFIGTYVKQTKAGVESKPLYIIVNKKGFREGGKGVITEYMNSYVMKDTNISRYSIIPGNNTAPRYNAYGNNFLEDVPEVIKNYIIPNANSQTNNPKAPGLSGTFIPVSTIDFIFGFDMNQNAGFSNQITQELDENGEVVDNAPKVVPSEPVKTNTINIYAGTGENADLSNFAVRPIDTSEIGDKSWEDKIPDEYEKMYEALNEEIFQTVEGAFQAAKFGYTTAYDKKAGVWNDEAITLHDKLMKASGPQAKKLGRTIKGLDVEAWNADSAMIMKILIKASFKQNPKALQRLLSTGNAILTHTQDKGKWGTEFPRILMEVREELRNTEQNNSNRVTPIPEVPSTGILSETVKNQLKEFVESIKPNYNNNPITLHSEVLDVKITPAPDSRTKDYSPLYKSLILPLEVIKDYPPTNNPYSNGILQSTTLKKNNDGTYSVEGVITIDKRGTISIPVEVTISGDIVDDYVAANETYIKDVEDYKKTGFKDVDEATRGSNTNKATAFLNINKELNDILSTFSESNDTNNEFNNESEYPTNEMNHCKK